MSYRIPIGTGPGIFPLSGSSRGSPRSSTRSSPFSPSLKKPPFLLDGHTIILDDYLELRPFDKEKLRDLVSSGRLSAGPFYAQTDMLLSHPEAIIRNLLLGDKSSRGFGRKTPGRLFP
jgi:alpha-mannosidase